MIHLKVALDTSLLQRLEGGQWNALASGWFALCQLYSLTDLGDPARFFSKDTKPTPHELLLLQTIASFLTTHLHRSVEHITAWLPDVSEIIVHPLTVILLPFGRYTFGPKEGLQFFSLDSGAAPLEAYLFLVHVYYHELSCINDTLDGRRYSQQQLTAEDFQKWIKLLIRNEGIGNYAILPELITLMEDNPDYQLRYFSYARQLGIDAALEAAVRILTYALGEVNDVNVAQFVGGINRIFRQERLSILNLVGVHMAQSIASRFGTGTLKNVYKREADEFFDLYKRTNARFAEVLGAL